MNREKDNHQNQTHLKPEPRLNKPIDSYLKNRTTTTEVNTNGLESLREISVYSDGSHSAHFNGDKPKTTKSAVVIYENGKVIDSLSKLHGEGWSDVAEYQAVEDGLRRLLELKLENEKITWYGDSQFVIRYLENRQIGKSRRDYYEISVRCINLLEQFKTIKFRWIPREQNKVADALSKI